MQFTSDQVMSYLEDKGFVGMSENFIGDAADMYAKTGIPAMCIQRSWDDVCYMHRFRYDNVCYLERLVKWVEDVYNPYILRIRKHVGGDDFRPVHVALMNVFGGDPVKTQMSPYVLTALSIWEPSAFLVAATLVKIPMGEGIEPVVKINVTTFGINGAVLQ